MRTCTGRSPVIAAPTEPIDGLRMRACGSSDARRGGAPAPKLAMADPNALPSCDGTTGPGGDRAREGWAELRLVLGPEGVPDPGVPAGLGDPAGEPVERIEAARCSRAEAEDVRLADGETFATRTVGLSGEMLPALTTLPTALPTAEREEETWRGDCERAGVFDSERMDSVDGVLRRRVGCATSASETIEDVFTRAFSGAPVEADMLELLSWRVTYASVSNLCCVCYAPLVGMLTLRSECGSGRCARECRSRRRVPRHHPSQYRFHSCPGPRCCSRAGAEGDGLRICPFCPVCRVCRWAGVWGSGRGAAHEWAGGVRGRGGLGGGGAGLRGAGMC